ncbi:MAG: hypothetical protein KJO87_00740 [Acidimicrobiia bacterium]|nr:hypothetical protein [Acidimicrobiia bacterium]
MHLRWIYVMDHAPLFAGLAALFVVSMAAIVLLVDGVVGDVLLGAVPTLFAVVVWAITNHAGYPNRDPVTLPHLRPEVPAGSEPAWDPFAGQRKAVPLAESGDPFDQANGADTTGAAPADSPQRPGGAKPAEPSSDAPPPAPRTHAPKARRPIEDNQPVRSEPAPATEPPAAKPEGASAPESPAPKIGPAQAESPPREDAPKAPARGPKRGNKKTRGNRLSAPQEGMPPAGKAAQNPPRATTPGKAMNSATPEEPVAPAPTTAAEASKKSRPNATPETPAPPTANAPAGENGDAPPEGSAGQIADATPAENPANPPSRETRARRVKQRPAIQVDEKAADRSDGQNHRSADSPAEAARRAAAQANREARERHAAPVVDGDGRGDGEVPLSPAEAAKRAAAERKRNRKRKAS